VVEVVAQTVRRRLLTAEPRVQALMIMSVFARFVMDEVKVEQRVLRV
jgi:hypothetical protein